MIRRYRKKPVIIEALENKGGNYQEIRQFMLSCSGTIFRPGTGEILIPTLEGDMRADLGDFIIKGIEGEFYPCKPGIFRKTYEEVIG